MESNKIRRPLNMNQCFGRLRKSIIAPHIKILRLNGRKIVKNQKNLTKLFQEGASQLSYSNDDRTRQGVRLPNARLKQFEVTSKYKTGHRIHYLGDCINLPSSFFSSKSFGIKSIEVNRKNKSLEKTLSTFAPNVISTPLEFALTQRRNNSNAKFKNCDNVAKYNDFVSFAKQSIQSVQCFTNGNITNEVLNRLKSVVLAYSKNNGDCQELQASEDIHGSDNSMFSQKGEQIYGNSEIVTQWLEGSDIFNSIEEHSDSELSQYSEDLPIKTDFQIPSLKEKDFFSNLNFTPIFTNQIDGAPNQNKVIDLDESNNSYILDRTQNSQIQDASQRKIANDDKWSKLCLSESIPRTIREEETLELSEYDSNCSILNESIQTYSRAIIKESEGDIKSPDAELRKIEGDRKWCKSLLNDSIETNTSEIVRSVERDVLESPHFRYRRTDIFQRFKWD